MAEPQPEPKPDDEEETSTTQADDGLTPEQRLENHRRLQERYPLTRVW